MQGRSNVVVSTKALHVSYWTTPTEALTFMVSSRVESFCIRLRGRGGYLRPCDRLSDSKDISTLWQIAWPEPLLRERAQ